MSRDLPKPAIFRPSIARFWFCLAIALGFLMSGEIAQAVEKTYRYFRFTPTNLRNSPSTANSIQISEFEFRHRGAVVSMAGVIVTNPGGNSPVAEVPQMVIDGNTNTKWLDFNKRELVFAFPARTTIDSYRFATANDSPERDPVSWKLEASEDGSSWTVIDDVSNHAVTTDRFTYVPHFYLPATGQVYGDPVSPQWHPDELLNWDPANDPDAPFNRSTVPLAARVTQSAALKVNSNARLNEGRVMPLIAFNTIPAASAQGSRTLRYYTPLFWQYMESMTFWGGSDRDTRSILAPSAHIVDAAHRNGVPVLGKIFFAFTSEATWLARVRSFLQKSGSTFPVADKLIEVADYYGFDGWFINQETSGTNSTDSQNMRDFIKYFRAKAPHLKIMWYDAMTESGSRSFQNALTTQNDGFMKEGTSLVAHSMFLNFWWGSGYNDTTKMPSSRQRALDLGLDPYDIYAGIDTEGRGFDTPVDWDSLFPPGQQHRLSLGIYRPEWTFNHSSGTTSFHNRELRYWVGANNDPSNTATSAAWKGIAHYIPDASPITSVPFVTNFNLGQGNRYVINGSTLMTGAWSNLSVQDVLPTWRWIVQSNGTKLTPTLEMDDAFYGGTSLKIAGTLNATNDIKLYRCSLPVTASTNLRIVYKRGAITASAMQVGVAFEDSPNSFQYLDIGPASSSGWNQRVFNLASFQGRKLAVIALRFTNPSPISSYSMRVGQLAIYNGSVTSPSAPSNLVVDRKESMDADTLSLRLKWTPSASPVHYYNVYLRNPDNTQVWLGATPNSAYFVPAARRKGTETSLRIEVEAVGPDFGISSRAQTIVALPPAANTRFPLTGTVIGTSGSYNNGGDTKERVFDGNPSTFFDAPSPDGAWAGLDLGSANNRVITALRFYPRTGWVGRMAGGVFQASNTPDFSDNPLTLGSVPITPVEGTYTTIAVNHPGVFRYVRYLAPNGAHGNVAEVQFFGVPVPAAPAAVAGSMKSGTASLFWSTSTYAGTYTLKRSTNSAGPYTVVAENIAGTTYSDSGLVPDTTYFYVVSAVNEAGEGNNSTPATISDAYAKWVVQRGWSAGSPASGFSDDANGDGIPNGVEYAAPAGLQISTDAQNSMITAEIRVDSTVNATLQKSFDLVTWTPVSFPNSGDQTGVPPGFVRKVVQEPISPATQRVFYRLRLTR